MSDDRRDRLEVLAEIEDLLRTKPPKATFHHPTEENFAWLGRASSAIEAWNPANSIPFSGFVRALGSYTGTETDQAERGISIMLHRARADLRMKTIGPSNVAIAAGNAFDYFDELRKVIEIADEEVFFIDPYLDAEFVSTYLVQLKSGVAIRLLSGAKRLDALIPAADMFAKQRGSLLHLRSSSAIHDRYLIVDKKACYQSGASFKDGAKKAPTTLTQITDAFPAVLRTYEDLWARANVHL
jgi:hypothetical protein